MNIEDRVLERVRKLLALARNNPSPQEAAVAFARAQELATRCGLQLDDLDGASDACDQAPPPRPVGPVLEARLVEGSRVPGWQQVAVNAICRANGCRAFLRKGFGAVDGLWAYGTVEDLAVARAVLAAVLTEVDALTLAATRVYKADPYVDPRWEPSPRSYAAAFRAGAADTIAGRLPARDEVMKRARAELGSAQGGALVRIDAAGDYLARLEDALDLHAEKLGLMKPRRVKRVVGSARGYFDGRRAGEGVGLSLRKAIG